MIILFSFQITVLFANQFIHHTFLNITASNINKVYVKERFFVSYSQITCMLFWCSWGKFIGTFIVYREKENCPNSRISMQKVRERERERGREREREREREQVKIDTDIIHKVHYSLSCRFRQTIQRTISMENVLFITAWSRENFFLGSLIKKQNATSQISWFK